ncbi:MAG TPA: DUF4912 domain-containing protein [Polyangiaceae bacterium]|jgi:hypothetical protein|nr:DUF4912 domain-containing protein [Polyangiaceae bacterium]
MNRVELEGLDREELISRAEAAGVTRARILTRPELVDELLLRSATDHATKQRSRGLFGRARDLLASVVERGLNLPDAAERIRTVGEPIVSRPSAPAALPTVTLAEIYATQGHRVRAIETLDRVLVREPEHAAARALVSQLRDDSYPLPPPRMPPEEEEEQEGQEDAGRSPSPDIAFDTEPVAPAEPDHMLDDAPLPTRYDVDECVAIPVDPRTLYVYWEVRDRTLEYIRSARREGTIALRVVVVVPTWDGPRSTVKDHDVHATLGDFVVRDLPPGCVVRAAIGYRVGDTFVAIAHSPPLETPADGPSPLVADVLVRWTPSGAVRVMPGDRDAPSIERALGRARLEAAAEIARGWGGAKDRADPLGSSERASARWGGASSS